MEKSGLLSLCALLTLALVCLTARAQTSDVCDPETKIPFPPEEQLDASTLLPLATITVPESCGDFVFTQLVGCGGELIIEEGCCDQSCKDIFALVPHECVKDIAEVLCSMPDFKDFVHTLNHMAKRCDDDYKKVSCKGAGKSSGKKGADEEPKDECTPEQKTPFEKKLTVDQLSPLLGTDLPATCDGFSPASLLSCQEDINFSDGCCNPECVDALATVDATCLLDFGKELCSSSPDLVPFLANLARRCKEGFEAGTCEDVAALSTDEEAPTKKKGKGEENGVDSENGKEGLTSDDELVEEANSKSKSRGNIGTRDLEVPLETPSLQARGEDPSLDGTVRVASDSGSEDDSDGAAAPGILAASILGVATISAMMFV